MTDGVTETVCAVVVTRDRRALLERCLEALSAQTRPPDAVVVVDNASTDGSPALVRERFPEVDLVVLPVNAGGAGGFHAGIGHAARRGFDWLWVLDDDTLARPDALEALLRARDRGQALGEPQVLASRVEWSDGRLHPMNIPALDPRRWREALDGAPLGLAPLRSASFVSVLLRTDAVRRHGLPLRRYFLWFDDVEYTSRLLRDELGLFVGDSVVEHATRSPYSSAEGSPERFRRSVRNRIFLARSGSLRRVEKLRLLRALAGDAAAFVRSDGGHRGRLLTVVRGAAEGVLAPRSSLVPDQLPESEQ